MMEAPGRPVAEADYGARRSGWLGFAGTLFVLLGAFHLVEGLVAIFKDEVFVVQEGQLVVTDYTAWGWFFLILGVVQVLVGFGILAGRGWARAVGIALAMLAAVVQIAYLVAFPIWALITIALCVIVIYGLLVPGGASEEQYQSRILE
jgi:hypothetical protein